MYDYDESFEVPENEETISEQSIQFPGISGVKRSGHLQSLKDNKNYRNASKHPIGEEFPDFLLKETELVNRYKQLAMQQQELEEMGDKPGPSKRNSDADGIDRPKSVRKPIVGQSNSKKASTEASNDQSDDDDEDEDESEYQPNQSAQIEGDFLGKFLQELRQRRTPRVESSEDEDDDEDLEENDEDDSSDVFPLELDDDFTSMNYNELAHLMALERLADDPDCYIPDIPTLHNSSDEEMKNALSKKRWREAVLDRIRTQLRISAKLSKNPGIHHSGYRMYQAEDYEGLSTTPEIKDIFQYISMYSPPSPTTQTEVKLKPFIPEFYPSVGDIDAFLKVIHHEIGVDNLGIRVLDEPCAFQSDPSVLDLRLRAMAKQSSARAVVVKKVEQVGKNSKVIDNWIKDISDLHRAKPSPSIHYSKPMPDIDQLIQEWPAGFEKLLSTTKLPSPDLDCDLKTYVNLVCGILDIPVYKSTIQSLHLLASLYLAHKTFGNYSFGNRGKSNKNSLGMDGREDGPVGPSDMTHEGGVDRLELE